MSRETVVGLYLLSKTIMQVLSKQSKHCLAFVSTGDSHPYSHLLKDLIIGQQTYRFFDPNGLIDQRYGELFLPSLIVVASCGASARLPFSIRVLVESAIRNCDGFHIKAKDVENILNWEKTQEQDIEIPFKPARVLLQDLTGVPVVVDFATMRDAFKALGGDPELVNPMCPTDLVRNSWPLPFFD